MSLSLQKPERPAPLPRRARDQQPHSVNTPGTPERLQGQFPLRHVPKDTAFPGGAAPAPAHRGEHSAKPAMLWAPLHGTALSTPPSFHSPSFDLVNKSACNHAAKAALPSLSWPGRENRTINKQKVLRGSWLLRTWVGETGEQPLQTVSLANFLPSLPPSTSTPGFSLGIS